MIYGGWFRRGDDFYPLNAIFQNFVLLCIVWQGMDWLKAKQFGKGTAAIMAVVGWPFVVAALLSAFPQITQMPWAATAIAFLFTSPLPMWTSITDGGWAYLMGGVVLYALRNHRKWQVAKMERSHIFGRIRVCVSGRAQSAGLCLDTDVHDLL